MTPQNRFHVIRLEDGRVWVLPARPDYCRRLTIRGSYLLTGQTFDGAFWFASGLLRGETGTHMTPYVRTGRSERWRAAGQVTS